MKLSPRLTALSSYFNGAHSIWDIGCDHGQLGLSFISELSVHEIHLVDPSALVVEVLKNKLKDSYITKEVCKISVHEIKGQEVVLNSERKVIFIAGMGGEEIREILIHLLPQLDLQDRVVISPHRKILELRKYLATSGFRLVDEQVLMDDGQFYQIICLSVATHLRKISLYGEALWHRGIGASYRLHQMTHFGPHKNADSQAYFAYLKSL